MTARSLHLLRSHKSVIVNRPSFGSRVWVRRFPARIRFGLGRRGREWPLTKAAERVQINLYLDAGYSISSHDSTQVLTSIYSSVGYFRGNQIGRGSSLDLKTLRFWYHETLIHIRAVTVFL